MMSKFKLNLKDIPQVNNLMRRRLLGFTSKKFYKKEIEEKGIPFFSEEELRSIEEKYKDRGMTKKDLMTEIYKKGWQIKENTIKSYIQKGLLPRSLKRVKTDQGMISVYPPIMIRHLNFTRYCLFSEDTSIKFLLGIIKFTSIDDKTILEEASLEIDDSGMSGDDCINSLWIGPARLRDEGLPWVEESIEAAFSKNKDKRKKYQKKFREIREISDQLENKIIEFENLLKKNTTPSEGINLKTWIDIRDKLREQEEKN